MSFSIEYKVKYSFQELCYLICKKHIKGDYSRHSLFYERRESLTCDKCLGLLVATRTAEARGLHPPEALEALELLRLSEGGGGRRGGPRAVTCNHKKNTHLHAISPTRIRFSELGRGASLIIRGMLMARVRGRCREIGKSLRKRDQNFLL